MQRLVRGIFIFAFAISFPAIAAFGDDDFISSDMIRALSFPELVRFRDSLNKKVFDLSYVVQRENNRNIRYDKIHALGVLQTEESMEALVLAIEAEIHRTGPQLRVIEVLIQAIGNIGSRYPHRLVEKLMQCLALVKEEFDLNKPEAHKIHEDLETLIQILMDRDATALNVEGLVHEREAIENTPAKQLERATEILEHDFIGQPEAIQALMDMEWRSQLYGKARTLPDLIYFMGLPGTGKDTAAEVFADALNGYREAWKEHLFRLPVMKDNSDLWKVAGSSTGFTGSENFPKFLEFLILHSDGKYILQRIPEEKKPVFRIVENPEYKGQTLPGYFPPNKGIVFANEFHNWSKSIKDEFLKQALERGIFTINNQNGGLAEIHVPIRFVVASNEGIGLIASRESNGQRFGRPMTYEQLLQRWQDAHLNKSALRAEILATNGSVNSGGGRAERSPGISEELLNRIPDRFLILLRPLSPLDLRRIAEAHLHKLAAAVADSPLIGRTELTWSNEIVAFLQIYDYLAEENARPILARMQSLVEQPLLDAVRDGHLSEADGQKVHLDLERNSDGTHSLVLDITYNGETRRVKQLMRLTLKDVVRPAITDERIDELADVEAMLKAVVFGVDPILERLAQRALSIENESNGGDDRPVNVIMLNGLSSTGKTETAKQYARIVKKALDELKTFDFSQIQTLKDFKDKILGSKDELGNPVPSEFMKLYDRNNGNIVVAFDELANVRDIDLLKALYDFFREPVVTTFSDGKPRKMGRVTVVVTGNPGQELYSQVPRNIPMEVQMLAWEEIYRRTANDPELQRMILERYYPEPLITRIGFPNIFFMPPHTYKSIRQLTQLKLGLALERLAVTQARRGWNVVFPNAEAYRDFVSMIIEEGFSLRYQGASIDTFVRDDFQEPLKALLLREKVPSGSTVVLKYRESTDNSNKDVPGFVIYDVFVDGKADPLELKFRRQYKEKDLERNLNKFAIVAYHEAGHSVVRQALFRDGYFGTDLSIIPGVDVIGGQWIYYLGIASSEQRKELSSSRDWVIRQIAILMAGETGERLVTRGGIHSAGKQNDIERASKIAHDAILRFGLSDKWGLSAVPAGMTEAEYIAGLSDNQRQLFESEVRQFLEEGRSLAEQTILANFETAFLPLGSMLLEKGKLKKEDLESFYAGRTLQDPTRVSSLRRAYYRALNSIREWRNPKRDSVEVELKDGIPVPASIADLGAIAAARKAEQYAEVPLPDKLPIGQNASYNQKFGDRPLRTAGDVTSASANCVARVTMQEK